MSNQSIGLIPLLVAMILDNYFTYVIPFLVCTTLCALGFLLLFVFRKDVIYQFLLIPTTLTLLLYSIFFLFNLHSILETYSILIAETLLVVVLAFFGFTKRTVLAKVRNSVVSAHRGTLIRTSLNEAYFMGQITQNLFTFHLFFILMYIHMPESARSTGVEHFLYRYLPIIIGLFILIYGQIRTQMMYGGLRKEVWLPVLNEKGQIIGSIARSVSRSSKKKYYHPIIRVAVVYNGMLYLRKRKKDEYVSPDLLDYPYQRYIRFRQSIESALHETFGKLAEDKSIEPRLMIRHTFENEHVKHLVNLYVVCLRTEEQLKHFTGGKLWTPKQIEDNLGAGIFSEYFEHEFSYLQTTVLLAESVGCGYDNGTPAGDTYMSADS